MGCSTLVRINNDGLARLEKHPQVFVALLVQAIRDGCNRSSPVISLPGFSRIAIIETPDGQGSPSEFHD